MQHAVMLIATVAAALAAVAIARVCLLEIIAINNNSY